VSVELLDDGGRPVTMVAPGDTLVVRASYHAHRRVSRPVFQIAIIDVDAGLVITTASSAVADGPAAGGDVLGDGTIECRFARLPLRPRQYVIRLSISDSDQLASYDAVTAGPRFAVTSRSRGVDGLADEEDGLVSLPYEFVHHRAVAAAAHRQR
jgi:hypothetical protein